MLELGKARCFVIWRDLNDYDVQRSKERKGESPHWGEAFG